MWKSGSMLLHNLVTLYADKPSLVWSLARLTQTDRVTPIYLVPDFICDSIKTNYNTFMFITEQQISRTQLSHQSAQMTMSKAPTRSESMGPLPQRSSLTQTQGSQWRQTLSDGQINVSTERFYKWIVTDSGAYTSTGSLCQIIYGLLWNKLS